MAKIYFTLTGTRHYYGSDFLKSGMKIYTMIEKVMSAGRIYDKIDDQANAKVVMVTPNGTLCKLSKKAW